MYNSMYNPMDIEQEVQKYWKEKKIPERIARFDLKTKRRKFYLLDGPPYANALPHVGHAMTCIFKDLWGKFKFMQGYNVWWQPGFDCHGLPIENKVEKEIGVKSKKDIENFGVEKFIQKCKEFSTKNLKEWMVFYKDVGAWKGWLEPYLTYNNSYIESGWWTVKRLYEKGFLVRGKKPIHWCPSCQTSLSGYEVTDSYKDVEDPSIYIKFPIKGKKNEYFLVWTTTPWTLPANVALIVHPSEKYVKIQVWNEKLILAKKLLDDVAQKVGMGYKVLEEFAGKDLVGTKYEPLLDVPIQRELKKEKNAHTVLASVPILKKIVASKVAEKKGIIAKSGKENFGHLVTMDVGTGIVHCAPGHGAEDNKIGEHYKLPMPSPVDKEGKLEEGTGFKGLFVKDADPKILEYLKNKNLLLHSEKIIHPYPLCWRCKSPLIYRLSNQWFFLIDPIKEKMIRENENVRWLPSFARERMRNWLENSTDWCVSIQRYWGIPFPIWVCDSCGSIKVLGSKKEVEENMVNKIDLKDLHKSTLDKVLLKCSCGGTMRRIPDLTNIWMESGISPWASLGYPHRNKELFEKLWNVDLVDESQDQIRGWFYSLLFMGAATFNERTYNTVCLNGWTLNDKGEKMSKSLGNVIWAKEAYNELGADLLRLYICQLGAPWETNKFSFKESRELLTFFNVLINIENFIKMYKVEFGYKEKITNIENKWILSKLNSLIKEVTEDLESFRFHFAGRKLINFILNDFSRFYMKFAKENIEERETSYVLEEVLRNYVKLLAPICPFISEKLYLSLFWEYNEKDSVHLCSYPKEKESFIDRKLEEEMEIAQKIIEGVYALRHEQGIKLRWPISRVFLSGNKGVKSAVKNLNEVLKYFCNTKEVIFDPNLRVSIKIKPNYRELGPVFGGKVKEVVELLKKETPEKLKEKLKKGDVILMGTEKFEITRRMVKVKEVLPEGKVGKTFENGVIMIDLVRGKELGEEALVRELVRMVQVKRKEAGLNIRDKVVLYLKGPAFLEKWQEFLKSRVETSKIVFGNLNGKYKGKLGFGNEIVEFGFDKK